MGTKALGIVLSGVEVARIIIGLGLGLGLDSVRGSTISHKVKYLPGYVTICAVTKLSVLFDFGFGIEISGRDIMIICCFRISCLLLG